MVRPPNEKNPAEDSSGVWRRWWDDWSGSLQGREEHGGDAEAQMEPRPGVGVESRRKAAGLEPVENGWIGEPAAVKFRLLKGFGKFWRRSTKPCGRRRIKQLLRFVQQGFGKRRPVPGPPCRWELSHEAMGGENAPRHNPEDAVNEKA